MAVAYSDSVIPIREPQGVVTNINLRPDLTIVNREELIDLWREWEVNEKRLFDAVVDLTERLESSVASASPVAEAKNRILDMLLTKEEQRARFFLWEEEEDKEFEEHKCLRKKKEDVDAFLAIQEPIDDFDRERYKKLTPEEELVFDQCITLCTDADNETIESICQYLEGKESTCNFPQLEELVELFKQASCELKDFIIIEARRLNQHFITFETNIEITNRFLSTLHQEQVDLLENAKWRKRKHAGEYN